MADTYQPGVELPSRWLPAWVMSFALHLGAVVLLIGVIERAPRGGLEPSDGSIDVVLHPTVDFHTAGGGEETPDQPAVAAVANDTDESSQGLDAAEPSEANVEGGNSTADGSGGDATAVDGGPYGPPGEGQASLRVFGVEGVGSKFVFVFDRSTSMEGPPLAAAKAQLLANLRALKPIHQFHIIFFNDRLRHFHLPDSGGRIAFATDRNKQLASRFVGGITADGGTDRFPALRAAIALRPDVIFFLTDAVDSMPASELAEIERLNRRVGAAISTIEFGRGPSGTPDNFLTRLAQLTGGQYGYVDTLRLEP